MRVLSPASEHELSCELKRVGIDPQTAFLRLPGWQSYVIKFDELPLRLARALKYAAESVEADFLMNQELSVGQSDAGAAFLIGTADRISRIAEAIQKIPQDGKKLAEEIKRAIEHYRTGPEMPEADDLPDARALQFFKEMTQRTLVMGILNITPDSFSDGGRYLDTDAAYARGIEMASQGADILDVGGESTRPGAEPVPPEEETRRTVPIIARLAKEGLTISIDTYHAATARAALDAGAVLVNDISGLSFDPDIKDLVAERRVPAVLMHIKGTPRNMQKNPEYSDLMGEICAFLREKIADAVSAGVNEKLLIIDPGIGFGKRVEHNLEILRRLKEITSLGRPILVGTSRKSTIGQVLGGLPQEERVEGTAATVALSIANGANIVRVHDVKEMVRVAKMTDAIVRT